MKKIILIYGPSGCGKSLLAKALFGEIKNANPSIVTAELKKSEILFEHDKKVKEIFNFIDRFHPVALLIEDIDFLFNNLNKLPAARQYLLSKINDEKNIFIIATSRHPEQLNIEEIELFSDIIPISYPNLEDRKEIIHILAQKRGINLSNYCNKIAAETEWLSGEELEKIVNLISKKSHKINDTNVNIAQNEVIKTVIIDRRKKLILELLEFTMNYCTDKVIRDEAQARYDRYNPLKSDFNIDKFIELKLSAFGCSINFNELLKVLIKKIRK